MATSALQQHHDIAMMAALAAKERCHGSSSYSAMAQAQVGSPGLPPAAAGKAVTDAYTAALATLNPPVTKPARKTKK